MSPPEGLLVVDEAGRQVFLAGRRVELSPTEFGVLRELSRRPGQVVSYDALLQGAWGTSLLDGGSLAQVQSAVKRLRQRLAASGASACRIVCVRGLGYRLELAPERGRVGPRSMRLALRLLLIAVALAALLAGGWLLRCHLPGDPPRPGLLPPAPGARAACS